MFQPLDGFDSDVVALRAVGKVSAQDYSSVLAPAIAKARSAGNKVRMVLELGPDFDGYEIGAMFADAKVGIADYSAFEKIAVVTDVDLIRHAIQMFAPFMPGQVRVVPVAELDSIRSWMAA